MEGERKAAGSGAENFRFGTMGNVRCSRSHATCVGPPEYSTYV